MKSWMAAIFRKPWRAALWCFRTKVRALVSTFVLLLLFGGGSFGAYKYSMSSTFCHSCHNMLPYCESWKESSHREVACVQCHFEPGIGNEIRGKWVAIKQLAATVTGAYSSMPYAEVSDASCMRSGCHTNEELSKPVQFTERSIGFKHETHTRDMRRGIKLACTSCHFQKLRDTHIEVDKGTCFLCHFKDAAVDSEGLGNCDTCHGPPEKVTAVGRFEVNHEKFVQRGMKCVQCHVELRPGTNPVGEERCYSCHNESEKIGKIGDAGLMHLEHVTKHKHHCYQCHDLIPHRFPRTKVAASGKTGKTDKTDKTGKTDKTDKTDEPAGANEADRLANVATATHSSKPGRHTQGDCASCHGQSHGVQALLFAGLGARGVDPSPDDMHALGLDCVGCHRAAVDGSGSLQTVAAPARSCAVCHEQRYDQFAQVFPTNADKLLRNLEGRLAAARAKIDKSRAAGQLIDRALYRNTETVDHNLRFLRRAVPIHNPVYAVEVLRATREIVIEIEEALGLEFDGDLPLGFEREDCGVCHDSLQAPGRLTLASGFEYPHPLHVKETGLSCEDCHQGRSHPPMAPTNESSCKSCHKDDENYKKKK